MKNVGQILTTIRKERLFIAIIFTGISLIKINAQKIYGKLTDNMGNAVEYATVTLKNASDSSFVAGSVSNENGNYAIPGIREGNYLLYVNMLGFKAYVSKSLSVYDVSDMLVNINLEHETQMLREVQVQSKKPVIEQEAGKTVMNVENSIVSQGLMAIELLKRIPGVVVDNEGNISLKGKDGVLLMIDGKPTYLSSKQAGAILKSLPSNQIVNIEVMTTPPAKYDAQGNAGIININLKKGSMEGFGGSIHASLGHGRMPKSNAGISITTGLKKWTLNAVYDFTANKDFTENNQNRAFGGNTSNERYLVNQYYILPWISNTYRLSADYQANSKLAFSSYSRGSISTVINSGTSKGKVTNVMNDTLIQQLTSTDQTLTKYISITNGINGRYRFDTLGHEISADIDHSYFDQKSSQTTSAVLYLANSQTPANNSSWQGELPTSVNIITSKIDYAKPFSKALKLEAGLKRIDIDINSDVKFTSSQSGSLELNVPTGNNFIYHENISAAYASMNYKKEKLTVNIGLRAEWWQAEGKQLNNGQRFTRDSIVPFPTITLRYKIFKNHELGINYNRRIDRPNYNSLNPISFYTDPYTVSQGNPRVRAQLTNNLEFSHSFMDGAVITTLNYNETSNFINDYSLVPNTDTTGIKPQVMTTINIPKFKNMGASVSVAFPVNKIWTTQFFVNVYQNQYSGSLFASNLDRKQWSYTINTSQMFALPREWSVEASGTYLSSVLNGYTINKPMGMISLGIQKNILKKKGTVKLAVQDVFYTFIYRGTINYAGVNSNYSYKWENRIITLSFLWKFGQTGKG